MDARPIIAARDLNLWYGAAQALYSVDMDIPEKQVTALIGPSGCGKSTFLKTLDRRKNLEYPERGSSAENGSRS